MRIVILALFLIGMATQLEGNAKENTAKPRKFRELTGMNEEIRQQIQNDAYAREQAWKQRKQRYKENEPFDRTVASFKEEEVKKDKKKKRSPTSKSKKEINPLLLNNKSNAFGKHLEGVYCDSLSDTRTQSGGECNSRVLSF